MYHQRHARAFLLSFYLIGFGYTKWEISGSENRFGWLGKESCFCAYRLGFFCFRATLHCLDMLVLVGLSRAATSKRSCVRSSEWRGFDLYSTSFCSVRKTRERRVCIGTYPLFRIVAGWNLTDWTCLRGGSRADRQTNTAVERRCHDIYPMIDFV